MNLWSWLSKAHGTFYRLQFCMVAQEVTSVVVTNVRVTTRTIYAIHADIRHYLVSVACDEVALAASELIVPRYLRYGLSTTYSHF